MLTIYNNASHWWVIYNNLVEGLSDCGLKLLKHGGSFFDYGLIREPQWNIIWGPHCVFNSHSNYRFVLWFFP